MTDDFRRPPRESGGIEIDGEVRALGARFQRILAVVTVGYLAAVAAGVVLVVVVLDSLPLVVPVLGGFLLGEVSLFRVRTELELATERTPAAVRSEFRRPINPVTALVVGQAEEVRPVEVPGAVAAVASRVTFLWAEAENRLVVTEGDVDPAEVGPGGGSGATDDDRGEASTGEQGGPTASDRDRVTADDRPDGGERSPGTDGGPVRMALFRDGELVWTARVRVRSGDDRTVVSVSTATRSRTNAQRLALTRLLEPRYQERIFECYGYEERDGEFHVGLLSGDGRDPASSRSA